MTGRDETMEFYQIKLQIAIPNQDTQTEEEIKTFLRSAARDAITRMSDKNFDQLFQFEDKKVGKFATFGKLKINFQFYK